MKAWELKEGEIYILASKDDQNNTDDVRFRIEDGILQTDAACGDDWFDSYLSYNECARLEFRHRASQKLISLLKLVDKKYKYISSCENSLLVLYEELCDQNITPYLSLKMYGIENPFTYEDGYILIQDIIDEKW